MSKNAQNDHNDSQVYKEAEYGVFCGLVADGLWKNNRFLADVCKVDEKTIARWKNNEEVLVLRQKFVSETLKKWKRSADPEKQLREQGMDFYPEKLEQTVYIISRGNEENS